MPDGKRPVNAAIKSEAEDRRTALGILHEDRAASVAPRRSARVINYGRPRRPHHRKPQLCRSMHALATALERTAAAHFASAGRAAQVTSSLLQSRRY